MLSIQMLSAQAADEIIEWKYEAPFELYNLENTTEVRRELLDGSYFALHDEKDDLFGYFCIGIPAQVPAGQKLGLYSSAYTDIGVGMNPLHVGQGKGFDFCTQVIHYIKELNSDSPLRLTVATFNQRAIHLYEQLGFVQQDGFDTDSNQFIIMLRDLR